jgi:hypothetical protein
MRKLAYALAAVCIAAVVGGVALAASAPYAPIGCAPAPIMMERIAPSPVVPSLAAPAASNS